MPFSEKKEAERARMPVALRLMYFFLLGREGYEKYSSRAYHFGGSVFRARAWMEQREKAKNFT